MQPVKRPLGVICVVELDRLPEPRGVASGTRIAQATLVQGVFMAPHAAFVRCSCVGVVDVTLHASCFLVFSTTGRELLVLVLQGETRIRPVVIFERELTIDLFLAGSLVTLRALFVRELSIVHILVLVAALTTHVLVFEPLELKLLSPAMA
jgi:hypothetical protein